MDAQQLLKRLPEPDPRAPDRIWRRFRDTRATARYSRSQRWGFAIPIAALGGAAAAALALWPATPEPQRVVALDTAGIHPWSAQVQLELDGHGVATGTDRDVVVQWESGTLAVDVVPNSGTSLSVVTEEAVIRVVGTAFEVRRDPLGVTTTVEHGRVAVSCEDGWTGELTHEGGPHTCLPTRPGALLGRAEFLTAEGAPTETLLETLDLGLARAVPGSAVEGELLARRVRARADRGEVGAALEDADRYLTAEPRSRADEVLQTAARLALTVRGCADAVLYLRRLEATGSAEDRILLASCLATDDPARARALVQASLGSGEPIDPAWATWARSFVGETP